MKSNREIKFDINDLYKILKNHDLEILKKYNHTEISDRDYFSYAINSDLISNSLNIIVNYLSGNLESAGVDNSCRAIIETLTILAMDAKGDISELQKTIYRYSYALVDLDNHHSLLDGATLDKMKKNELTKQILDDAEKCKTAIITYFNCSKKDLSKRDIELDDPCFYLKKHLNDKIKFSKLVKQYFENNKALEEMYNFFSIFIHPRCEIDGEFEKVIMDYRKVYINQVIDMVFNYLKDCNLLHSTDGVTDFNTDFFYNPLLQNNVHSIKEFENLIHLIKTKLCVLPDGDDWFTWSFLERLRYIIIDMLISVSLGYTEHVISNFKPFIETFAVFYDINKNDLKDFNYLKEGYWLSSRLQFEYQLQIRDSKIKYNFKDKAKELYELYYKEKYHLNSFDYFYDKLIHNSMYFLSDDKRSFNKYVKEVIEELIADENMSKEMFTLYRMAKDMGHASGYNFNATDNLIRLSSHKVIYSALYLLLNFVINSRLTLEEHNIFVDLSNEINFLKTLIELENETILQTIKQMGA